MLRHPAAGSQIASCVQSFPYLQLDAQLHPITRTVLRIQLNITPSFTWKDRSAMPGWLVYHPGNVFIGLLELNSMRNCGTAALLPPFVPSCRSSSTRPNLQYWPPLSMQRAWQRAEVAGVG